MTNKQHSSVLVGIMIAIFCLALIIALKPEQVTGAAVRVKYYGVSDVPLAKESGKIQTYVKLSKESVKDLKYDWRQTDLEVMADIAEASDFGHGIVEIYEANPVARIQSAQLKEIMTGTESLVADFKANTRCMIKAAFYRKDDGEAEFVIVTELKYTGCIDYYKDRLDTENWMGATAVHTYYAMNGEYICSDESYPLFIVNKVTGELDSNIGQC